MNRFTFLITFFLGVGITTTYAQNLVPNGSFEKYKKLPNGAINGKIDSFVNNWIAPTNGSPDYYHIASNSAEITPPNISLKRVFIDSCYVYCYPFTGSAFAGFISGHNTFDSNEYWFNEYLQVKLQRQLKKHHKYLVKFYIYNVPCNQLELPELGMFISSFQPKHDYVPDWSKPFNYKIATNFLETYTPQITVGEKSVIKGEWMLIEKIYKSIADEQYITIGNFSQSNFKVIPRDTVTERNVSYYFIDEVSVIETPGIIAPDSACYNETITMQSGFNGPFAWYKNNTLFSTDSIVHVRDTTNNWYYLHTPFGNDSLYLVIKPNPFLTAMADTTICEGTQINLAANSNANNLKWMHNNLPTNTLVNKAGTYLVVADKDGCTAEDSVKLTAIKLPQVSITDKQLCTVKKEEVTIELPSGYFYYWPQFNDSLKQRSIDSAGCYKLSMSDIYNCTNHTTFCVEDVCAPKVFIPNAFVPDGVNKTFKPVFNYVVGASWQIYNRWGQIVFEANNKEQDWDGTYKNKPCEAGSYLFTITYEGFDGKEIREKGSITLIR